MTRKAIAAVVIALWAIGLGVMAYRQTHTSEWEQLAEAAVRVNPAAYYYKVYQGDTQIGVASSAIDTVKATLKTTDYFRGQLRIAGDTQSVEGSMIGYLTRRLSLDSFRISVSGGRRPLTLRGTPTTKVTPLFLPTLAAVPFILSGTPAVGREGKFWIYNPITREVQRTPLRIQAESLFTVSDSARFDSTSSHWVSAHQDTVRAWAIAPRTSGVKVWVDLQGRIVSASEPGGLRLLRFAYEEAFSNWRSEHR